METKQDYVERMERQLEDLKTRIEELKIKAEKLHDQKRDQYQQHIQDSKEKHKSAHEKLVEIRTAAGEEWKTLKGGFEELVEDVQETMDKAVSNM